ncbi:MAG: 2-C-methyl-D-erythritol 4-phosphate cytidylyltransferase [Planctomycetota bacterium]
MHISVIIPAAGGSTRFGDRDKLAEDLRGRPVLNRTVELFAKRDEFQSIVVAGPNDPATFDAFKFRFGDTLGLLGATVCRGGTGERHKTVRAALEHVPDETTHIAVHDGARPCTPREVVDRVLDAIHQFDAVIPAIPVTDTLKQLSEDDVAGEVDPLDAILGDAGKTNAGFQSVQATVPRDRLVAVQTPQVFEASLLRRAYEQDDLSSTDDAGLIERLGERVVVVDGDPRNLKITTPMDLVIARAILDERGEAAKAARAML